MKASNVTNAAFLSSDYRAKLFNSDIQTSSLLPLDRFQPVHTSFLIYFYFFYDFRAERAPNVYGTFQSFRHPVFSCLLRRVTVSVVFGKGSFHVVHRIECRLSINKGGPGPTFWEGKFSKLPDLMGARDSAG